jgi:hypothetical protein
MPGFSTGLLLGISIGAVGFWYVQKKANEHPAGQARHEQPTALRGTSANPSAANLQPSK